MGARFCIYPFDGSKSSWFWTDVDAVFHLWLAAWGIIFLIAAIIFHTTGTSAFNAANWLMGLLVSYVGIGWAVLVLVTLSIVPAFVWVFVLRRNGHVLGAQRQFRYFCRFI